MARVKVRNGTSNITQNSTPAQRMDTMPNHLHLNSNTNPAPRYTSRCSHNTSLNLSPRSHLLFMLLRPESQVPEIP
jgi:hypothetical protein